MKQRPFRKRHIESPGAQAAESLHLAKIASRVDTRDFSGAIAEIDSTLTREKRPEQQAKLLSQVARTLHKRGKFSEASQYFTRASELAKSEARDWLPPEVSKIRALIKNVSIQEANQAAQACYTTALTKIEEFSTKMAGASAELARTGTLIIPLKPHRSSVVASTLGELFFSEGELETAKFFFQKAIDGNPRGGTRARQGLAEIALRMDDPETAFQRAVEALTLGKFQAKTIASWKPFFAAKRKLQQTGLAPEFIASIKVCRPSVRARTILTIVRELRSANDPQWKSLSEDWLKRDGASFPAVAAELRKMAMSETKRAMKDPEAQVAAARALLATENLAPHEWLAGAKELVRASLFAKADPNLPQLLNEAATRYGIAFVPQLQHSLALSCMMAKRHDLARPILQTAIASTARSRNHIWSKAWWALGRMESVLKNYSAAAAAFANLSTAAEIPIRFRLQAKMLWAENLLATGDAKAIQACATSLPAMLADVRDYEILLDFARQLSHSKGKFKNLAEKIYLLGESIALQAFAEASHPSQAIDILFKLTRRQVYDFGRSKAVISFWNSLSEEKKNWLWNNDNQWWGYLAFILIAHLRTNNLKAASELAEDTLSDPAVPRTALPSILIPYNEELIFKGFTAQALQAFEWIVTENPTKAGCATANYWLALAAYKRSDLNEANARAEAMRISNAHTEITYNKWMFEAKALLILAGLNADKVSQQAVNYDRPTLAKAEKQIRADLLRLRL